MRLPQHYSSIASLSLAMGLLACASGSIPMPGDMGPPLPAEARETSTGAIIRVGPEQRIANSEIDAPLEIAWPALARAYSALGIEGQVLDSRERIFGTRRFTKSRIGGRRVDEFVRCAFQGTGPSAAGAYRTQLSIVSRIESSSSDRSMLTTQIAGVATSVEGTSADAVRCVSNGNLERLIATTVSDSVSN